MGQSKNTLIKLKAKIDAQPLSNNYVLDEEDILAINIALGTACESCAHFTTVADMKCYTCDTRHDFGNHKPKD